MREWRSYRLDNIGNIITGSTPSTNIKKYWNGDFPFYSPADFTGSVYCYRTEKTITGESLKISRPIPKKGIMFTCIASIGKVAISGLLGITNQQINTIIPFGDFDYKYIYYTLLFNSYKFVNYAPQTTIPIVNKTDFGKFSFSFPPLPHQRKIARVLTTVDNIIEKTENAIEKYKAIKQGMMHDLFTRGIDVKTGKLRPSCEDAPELYKKTELGMIPKEWEMGTIDMIAFVNPSFKSHNLSNYDLVSFIPMECVSNDANLISTYEKKVSEVFQGFTHFRDGDILFAKITPCMENGKGALVNGLKNEVGYGSTEFHVLRPIKQQSTLFLYYLTTSHIFRLKAEGKMTGSAGQQRVPSDFVTKYKLGIPLLKEQKLIGNRLNALNIKLKCEQKYLLKIRQLKQGLMQDLLTGKKEVTPDPEDFNRE